MADDFTMCEEGGSKTYTKQGVWMDGLCQHHTAVTHSPSCSLLAGAVCFHNSSVKAVRVLGSALPSWCRSSLHPGCQEERGTLLPCMCIVTPLWVCYHHSQPSQSHGLDVVMPADYLGIFGAVVKAIPDFKWGAATNAETDSDGFAIVTVTATGTCRLHHQNWLKVHLPLNLASL